MEWQIIRNENNEIIERVLVGTNIKIVREYCGSFRSDSYFNVLVVNGNDDLTKTTELGSGYTLNMLKEFAKKLAVERKEKEK